MSVRKEIRPKKTVAMLSGLEKQDAVQIDRNFPYGVPAVL